MGRSSSCSGSGSDTCRVFYGFFSFSRTRNLHFTCSNHNRSSACNLLRSGSDTCLVNVHGADRHHHCSSSCGLCGPSVIHNFRSRRVFHWLFSRSRACNLLRRSISDTCQASPPPSSPRPSPPRPSPQETSSRSSPPVRGCGLRGLSSDGILPPLRQPLHGRLELLQEVREAEVFLDDWRRGARGF